MPQVMYALSANIHYSSIFSKVLFCRYTVVYIALYHIGENENALIMYICMYADVIWDLKLMCFWDKVVKYQKIFKEIAVLDCGNRNVF